jgi:hypothetical protein
MPPQRTHPPRPTPPPRQRTPIEAPRPHRNQSSIRNYAQIERLDNPIINRMPGEVLGTLLVQEPLQPRNPSSNDILRTEIADNEDIYMQEEVGDDCFLAPQSYYSTTERESYWSECSRVRDYRWRLGLISTKIRLKTAPIFMNKTSLFVFKLQPISYS